MERLTLKCSLKAKALFRPICSMRPSKVRKLLPNFELLPASLAWWLSFKAYLRLTTVWRVFFGGTSSAPSLTTI